MSSVRQTRRLRLTAVIALAYALVLQGLLGALGSGAQAREAVLASQLGVICTIHGVVDPVTGQPGGEDPTPGKLACVEHCVLMSGQPSAPAPAVVQAAPPVVSGGKVIIVTPASGGQAYPSAAPPPPRGPPVF